MRRVWFEESALDSVIASSSGAGAAPSGAASLMTAESYAESLEEIVVLQERAQLHVRVLLEDDIAAVVPKTVDYVLTTFGSRAFEPGGYCLPSSDFDLVCELAAGAHAVGFTPKYFLQLEHGRLRVDLAALALGTPSRKR